MSIQLSPSLTDIYPLRFRLREELRFTMEQDAVVAERTSGLQRYALQCWQFEMLMRLDGRTTFEEASKQVFALLPGGFTATGLFNFYNWLYDENLVLCAYESIFELVIEDHEKVEPVPVLVPFKKRIFSDPRARQALKIAAAIVLSLSVIRLVLVASPLWELPMKGFFAEPARTQKSVEELVSASSERVVQPVSVKKMELATQVKE